MKRLLLVGALVLLSACMPPTRPQTATKAAPASRADLPRIVYRVLLISPQGLGAIEHTEGKGPTYAIRGTGDDFVTDVINIIAREGIRVRGFRTEIPTLEDVFLKLTGHGIRD